MSAELAPIIFAINALGFGAGLSLTVATWAKDRMWIWPVAGMVVWVSLYTSLPNVLRLTTGLVGAAVTAWVLIGKGTPESRWEEGPPGPFLRIAQGWAVLGILWFVRALVAQT